MAGDDQLGVRRFETHVGLGDAELEREEVLDEEAQHEGRHGDQHQCQAEQTAVPEGLGLEARDDAERDPGDHGEDEGEDRQSDGDRVGIGDDFGDRTLRSDLRAEVALEQIAQVVQILLPDRLVQSQIRLQCGDLRSVYVLFTGKCSDGVAGQCVHHQEDQQGRPEEDRDHLEQSSCDIAPHGCLRVGITAARGPPLRRDDPRASGRAEGQHGRMTASWGMTRRRYLVVTPVSSRSPWKSTLTLSTFLPWPPLIA